uniref:Yippee domain-containing protein n=1 Tax=Sinocyclocheilus rhinocerous TaxID=307959 RepID=A0A673JQA8_9TELE
SSEASPRPSPACSTAYLPNCHRTYSCIHCRAHLANHDELISKVSSSVSFTLFYLNHRP